MAPILGNHLFFRHCMVPARPYATFLSYIYSFRTVWLYAKYDHDARARHAPQPQIHHTHTHISDLPYTQDVTTLARPCVSCENSGPVSLAFRRRRIADSSVPYARGAGPGDRRSRVHLLEHLECVLQPFSSGTRG
eukprot:4058252-Prymnesium_polylepis.4